MAYATTNPATGEVVRSFPNISDVELNDVLDRTHAAYSVWRMQSVADRAKVIVAAAAGLRSDSDRLAGLVTLEMGKLLAQAKAEVELAATILEYYAERASAYLQPQALSEAPGATVMTRPIGVILAVEPWNFPYYQLARVAGPQLMVGNVVICKHASSTPQCAQAFADVLLAAGVPDGAFANVYANFDQIGRLVDDPRVRGVTVTGSEGAGAIVAERAGKNMKKSVLELGGSDALIVLEDAPFEATVDNAMWGRMNNTGQSCVASKRVIVVGKARGARFLTALTERMKALVPGDPVDASTTLGPLSSERALNNLVEQIAEAKDNGATIVLGGSRIDRPGFYLQATILTDIDSSNPAFQNEFFGPVLCFYVVDTVEDAIELANATSFGLGGSVFTADVEHGRRVADSIDSGMVFVNNPTWTAPELPFGGVKNSGYGRELSMLGFGEFVNKKLISVSAAGSPPPGAKHAG